jgi:hypothetical protein
MQPDSQFCDIPCREWSDGETDRRLIRDVPGKRLSEFRSVIVPLRDEEAEVVRERLFRGIRRPFHYQLCAGWLGDALRMEGKARHVPLERVGETFGWTDDTLVLLVYQLPPGGVLVGRWSTVLRYLAAGWLPTGDNLVLCSDNSQWAGVYWDCGGVGGGPRCVRRGRRRLLSDAVPE